MIGFFLGLGLMCASTLMYEITLTRLLSVTCWYYLAFVSVSMAMFGMTAGALAVQLRPALFDREQVRLRMAQAAFAMAVSMPIVLMIMFAIPLDISFAVQTVASFLIFCSFIAVPFFFAGIVVCLSLTKASAPIGRVYFADLMGAAAGCFGSVILLNLVDAPSAVLVISALVFLSASAYAEFAAEPRLRKRCYIWAGVLVVLAALNASTIHGIQPIWSKGKLDPRTDILYETWNPISRVRVVPPKMEPRFVGPADAAHFQRGGLHRHRQRCRHGDLPLPGRPEGRGLSPLRSELHGGAAAGGRQRRRHRRGRRARRHVRRAFRLSPHRGN